MLSDQNLNYLKWFNQEDFFGRLLCPLLKAGLPLIKDVVQPLAKSISTPLGSTAAAPATDVGIHKKHFRFRNNNTNNIKWWDGIYY